MLTGRGGTRWLKKELAVWVGVTSTGGKKEGKGFSPPNEEGEKGKKKFHTRGGKETKEFEPKKEIRGPGCSITTEEELSQRKKAFPARGPTVRSAGTLVLRFRDDKSAFPGQGRTCSATHGLPATDCRRPGVKRKAPSAKKEEGSLIKKKRSLGRSRGWQRKPDLTRTWSMEREWRKKALRAIGGEKTGATRGKEKLLV